ncbi:MAG TPA: hypothetical protein VNI61_04065 [Gemmatimonadales bacterium]|nr:hypothetical protein [Gemmatimonadales bacterium]
MPRSWSLFVAALGLVACAEERRDPLGPPLHPAASTMQEVSQDPTPDQMAVARVVPTFGGYFLDARGRPTVYLGDARYRPEAEQALAGFLADRGFTAADLVVRQGTYDWIQLDGWHEQAWRQVLAVTGAVFTDIDEGSNRLRFGGVDPAALQRIRDALARAGVPSDASIVELSGPIQQLVTLRDRVRPVHGGYQINFAATDPLNTVSFLCTLGFNVVKGGTNSFITNSHCTNHQGGTTPGTDYYQPLRDPDADRIVNPENLIGHEVEDPEYDPISCAEEFIPGAVCRFSDAARAEYAAGQPFALGRIARTTARYQDRPPTGAVLEVDPNSPSFRVNGEQRRSVLGEEANKVGRTTGWTFGPVIQTCINTLVLGTVPPIIQRCQDRVRADVAGGDSGSPVFRWLGGSGNVRLMGILWGGSVSGEVTFVFSPMGNIHMELGDFQTH